MFVSPTEETVPLEGETTLPSPRFDEKSVQRARPAVPLTLGARARSWPLTMILLCVVGGVAGGILGGLALTLYQGGDSGEQRAAQPSRQEPADGVTAAPQQARPDLNPVPDGAATAQPAAVQPVSVQPAQPGEMPGGTSPAQPPAAERREESADADAGTQGELRAALGEWLAATNSRDVGRQMRFYAPTVDAFYLSRNAKRDAVRAEKVRIFSQAESVNVEAAQPEIRLSGDGRTAVMRFRKRYQITGGQGARNGEVLQELRWRRTPSGWKIVSERDLRVLN